MKNDRRHFIKTSGMASIGVTCAPILFQAGCGGYRFVHYTQRGQSLVISKKEFAENQFVLVKYPALPAPIYVIQTDQDEYTALLLLCTHKQCEVRPGTEILICPCHGSEYSNTGDVLNPPAEKALQSFPISINEDEIHINII